MVPNSRIVLLPRNILYIKKVERNDKGIYQCFVWNSFHSLQTSSSLNLKGILPFLPYYLISCYKICYVGLDNIILLFCVL